MPQKMKKLIFFIIALAAGLFFFFLYIGSINHNKVSYGVSVAGTNISGSNYETAKNKIKDLADQKEKQTIEIKYEDKKWLVLPQILGISIEEKMTAETVYLVGHGKNIFIALVQQIDSFIRGRNIGFIFALDDKKFSNFIQENLSESEKPAINATLKYDKGTDDFLLVRAQEGQVFDRENFKKQLDEYLSSADPKPIELKKITDNPVLTEDKNNTARNKAKSLISLAPYLLKNSGQNWQIDKQIILDWLVVIPAINQSGTMTAVISETDIKDFLSQLAPSINKQPINAKLMAQDGKIVAFDLSQQGLELQIDESAKKISEQIETGKKEIYLVVLIVEPEISAQTIDTLGLNSLLGIGR